MQSNSDVNFYVKGRVSLTGKIFSLINNEMLSFNKKLKKDI